MGPSWVGASRKGKDKHMLFSTDTDRISKWSVAHLHIWNHRISLSYPASHSVYQLSRNLSSVWKILQPVLLKPMTKPHFVRLVKNFVIQRRPSTHFASIFLSSSLWSPKFSHPSNNSQWLAIKSVISLATASDSPVSLQPVTHPKVSHQSHYSQWLYLKILTRLATASDTLKSLISLTTVSDSH